MELSASRIAALTGGVVRSGDPDAVASGFGIDSRRLRAGEGFAALTAERDGHDFVEAAFASGATVAIVARPSPAVGAGRAVVEVANPLAALATLAAAVRDELATARVVGITGSAGKTGTKDLTAAALGAGLRVHASPVSFNNEAGVPLTLLAAPADVEAVVLEMGARGPGEIRALCRIARPTIGVITNIGLAHAGRFGGPDGVARAKGELVEALDRDGVAVLRAVDDVAHALAVRTSARCLTVGDGETKADVRVSDVHVDGELRPTFLLETPWGKGPVRLELRGEHQVLNAALAATVALVCGVDLDGVRAALSAVRAEASRMELTITPDGVHVLDDSYNANPASMAAGLRGLAGLQGVRRRVAVLGDMLELGAASEAEHAAVGELAGELGLDVVVAVGDEIDPLAAAAARTAAASGRKVDVVRVADARSALAILRDALEPGDAVLIKGSRALGLERVARGLLGGNPEVAG